MNYQSEILKLNKVYPSVKFYCGEYSSCLNSVIKQNVPYGKIGFIALESSHLAHAKKVLAALTNVGSKLISLVLKEVPKNKIEDFSKAFALPEDVRAVITFDRELCALCSYFATVKKLPFIYIPNSVCVSNCFDRLSFIKNGDATDCFLISNDFHVIIDSDLIENGLDEACAYAAVVSKISALADYRLYCALKNKNINLKALAFAKKSINRVFDIFNVKPQDRKKELFTCGIKCELANTLSGGEINARDSSDIVAETIADRKSDFFGVKLFASLKILRLYAVIFELKKPLCNFPETLKSVNEVALFNGENAAVLAEKISLSITETYGNLSCATRVAQSMQKAIKENLRAENGIKNTYLSLNGFDGAFKIHSEIFWNAFKAASFNPRSINGCIYSALMGVSDLNIII